LTQFILLQAAAFVVTFLYSSFFEWTLHRFFMHRKTFIEYPFKAHAQVHHQVFKSDKTYELQNPEDKWLITFAWWNYPLLLGLQSPIILAFELAGIHIALGAMMGMTFYYFAYEYLHFCMHKPEGRFFENWAAFKFINRHHTIHHKYMHRNLNVVFPLADLVLGTLILRPKHSMAGKPVLTPAEAEAEAAAPANAEIVSA
jgi:hypothetical protein